MPTARAPAAKSSAKVSAVGPLVGTWAYGVGGYGFTFIMSGSVEIAVVVVALVLLARWKKRGWDPRRSQHDAQVGCDRGARSSGRIAVGCFVE